MNNADYQKLEPALETQVLSKYDLPAGETTWRSHDTIGPDDVAHYFTRADSSYVLVWSDFPSETFIHDEALQPIYVAGGSDEWLHITGGELVGYYSLYLDA